MKKWICLLLAITTIVCVTACDNTQKPADTHSPTVATGEYNGQTITMSYMVTEVGYPADMRSIAMQQGFAVFYDHAKIGANNYDGDTWNLLDRNGNRVLTEPYQDLASFNKDGIAVAKKMDGTYVQLNIKLEETAITEQEYLDFSLDAKNYPCTTEYPQGEGNYSCLSGDLALYVEYKDTTAYVGLVDKSGNVIIEAFIPIYYSDVTEHLHLSEDIAFVEDVTTNNIGIITITRS